MSVAAEQHRDNMNRGFVNEAALKEVLCNVCAAYRYLLIARRFFRFFKRGFHFIVQECNTEDL